jgi:hypothetical protein
MGVFWLSCSALRYATTAQRSSIGISPEKLGISP